MPPSPGEAGLSFDRLSAGYGGTPVVRGVSARIGTGRIAAVIGPNGSGKSTLVKAIVGAIPAGGGEVFLDGVRATNRPRHLLARQGLVYVPQENEVFRSLTVRENLEIGAYLRPPRAARAAVEQ